MPLIGTYVNPFGVWPSAPVLVHVCCVWLPFFNGIAPSTHSPAHSLSHSLSQSVTRARNFRTRIWIWKGLLLTTTEKQECCQQLMGPKRRKAEQQHHNFGLRPHQNKHPMEALATDHGTASSSGLWCVASDLQPIDCRHLKISAVERNSIKKKKEVLSEGEQLIPNFLYLSQIFLCV